MGFPRNHVIKVIEDFGVEEKEVRSEKEASRSNDVIDLTGY